MDYSRKFFEWVFKTTFFPTGGPFRADSIGKLHFSSVHHFEWRMVLLLAEKAWTGCWNGILLAQWNFSKKKDFLRKKPFFFYQTRTFSKRFRNFGREISATFQKFISTPSEECIKKTISLIWNQFSIVSDPPEKKIRTSSEVFLAGLPKLQPNFPKDPFVVT